LEKNISQKIISVDFRLAAYEDYFNWPTSILA